jgi:wyosine [tRNA(Phe)-imidazoG37] synthetase (radical SAM superfamily)
LGRSLGINNIPPKECTYACVYCQVGPTTARPVVRRSFYDPQQLVAAVRRRVEQVSSQGGRIDYLTFVPDGEPVLDINLGDEIGMLRSLGIPIAIISNASLFWNKDVRDEVAMADWVSMKVDTVDEYTWRGLNRPNPRLDLDQVLDGIAAFGFDGTLTTETMLVEGINDAEELVEQTAIFLGSLDIDIAYVSIPTRPPALPHIRPPSDETIVRSFHQFQRRVEVELLIEYEGDVFTTTGDARSDLLGVTAVHPMRRSAVEELLRRDGASWEIVAQLIAAGELQEITYKGHTFYLRRRRQH